MAHEIRNPLTTIALYGDILESDLQRLQSEQLRSQAETARAALFARRALLRQESNYARLNRTRPALWWFGIATLYRKMKAYQLS